MKRTVLAALLLGASAAARSDVVEVCFNYGCNKRAEVNYDSAAIETIRLQFEGVASAADERYAIGWAVAWMYQIAGTQTPVWRDRGGNIDDDAQSEGRMDCIDHSTNATAFLRSMERWGLLRFHRAGDPVQRGIFLSLHLAASVVALGSGDVYAVDSWFYDPGNPATIYTLDEWRRGKRPPGTELFRWSKY